MTKERKEANQIARKMRKAGWRTALRRNAKGRIVVVSAKRLSRKVQG